MYKKLIKRKSIYLTGIEKLKIIHENRSLEKDEVLIKVNSCGICSSDLKFYFTGSRIKKFPIILGHEISGTIIDIDKKQKLRETNKKIVFGAEVALENAQLALNLKKIQIYVMNQHQLDLTTTEVFQISL